MTTEQQKALRALLSAHKMATTSGLFDVMASECASPKSINDVCDAAELISDEMDGRRHDVEDPRGRDA